MQWIKQNSIQKIYFTANGVHRDQPQARKLISSHDIQDDWIYPGYFINEIYGIF